MTEEDLVGLVLSGNDDAWQDLYVRCRDPELAKRLAEALERESDRSNRFAVAWAGVLNELHPELKVTLKGGGIS